MKTLMLGVWAVLFAFVACSSTGSTRRLESSSVIPGAQGELRVSEGENQNTKLVLQVKHLAKPASLPLGGSSYVVWARPFSATGEAQNLGALSVDDDLNGKLETVTPFPQFSLFITAEPTATVTRPSGDPLLWTNVSRAAE